MFRFNSRSMRLLSLVVVSFTVVLAGCESTSVPDRVRERFEPVPPKVRVYDADQRTVFDAAQSAVRQIDFRVTRAGAVQGVVDGLSRIQPGDSFSPARQFTIEVRLQPVESGKTEVAVLLREQEESKAFAGATNLPLREHGLYGSFFSALEHALPQKPAPTAPSAK